MTEGKMDHKHGKVFMTTGVLAIVYGVINYLIVGLQWPDYGAWIAGGIILILLGWAKSTMRQG